MLEKVGIDAGKAELEIILCSLLGVNRLNLYLNGETLLSDDIERQVLEIVKKRKTRYPLQYILEESWFYGRKFFVSPAVMVPTPETEVLCEAAIGFINSQKIESPKILDIGAGSGIISVTVAKELDDAEVLAVDISEAALDVTRKNAADLGAEDKISFRHSNLFENIYSSEKFDLILSNPPYISEEEYKSLPPEVLADPKISLTSGEEGLDVITDIIQQAPDYLMPGGKIMFEIGCNQAERVMKISERHSRYQSIVILKDLNDIDRVAILSL